MASQPQPTGMWAHCGVLKQHITRVVQATRAAQCRSEPSGQTRPCEMPSQALKLAVQTTHSLCIMLAPPTVQLVISCGPRCATPAMTCTSAVVACTTGGCCEAWPPPNAAHPQCDGTLHTTASLSLTTRRQCAAMVGQTPQQCAGDQSMLNMHQTRLSSRPPGSGLDCAKQHRSPSAHTVTIMPGSCRRHALHAGRSNMPTLSTAALLQPYTGSSWYRAGHRFRCSPGSSHLAQVDSASTTINTATAFLPTCTGVRSAPTLATAEGLL